VVGVLSIAMQTKIRSAGKPEERSTEGSCFQKKTPEPAYDVLTRLTRDGLVNRVEKDGRLHIAAEDPGRLLGVLEDRRRTVDLMPEGVCVFGELRQAMVSTTPPSTRRAAPVVADAWGEQM
jgi:hypothetical protein